MKRFVLRPWLLVLSILTVIVAWGLFHHYQWQYGWAHRLGLITLEEVPMIEIGEAKYIAHSGGAIDGHNYTNSKEAVLKSLREGYRFVELDLRLTLDGHYFAAHYYSDFNKDTDHASFFFLPPTASQVKSRRLHGQYTPLLLTDVAQLMKDNPEMILVIDKGNDYAKMLSECPFPDRMIVEVSTYSQFVSARHAGFKYAALGGDADESTIDELGIRLLVVNKHFNPDDPLLKYFLQKGGVLMVSGFDQAQDIPPAYRALNTLFYIDQK